MQRFLHLFVVLFLFSLSVTVHAINLYGPDKFIRDFGSPVVRNISIQSPTDFESKLIIKSGIDDGPLTSEKVSSSIIFLNGERIVSPDQFNQTVSNIEVPVVLKSGLNYLSVELRGKPGGELTLSIPGPVDTQGGIYGLSIDSDSECIPVFAGEVVKRNITFLSTYDDANYVFQVIDGPSSFSVGDDGEIIAEIPNDLSGGASIPFEISIMNETIGTGVNIKNSFCVIDAEIIREKVIDSSGGVVADDWENVVIDIPEGATTNEAVLVKILKGYDSLGRLHLSFTFSDQLNGPVTVYFPGPELFNLNNHPNTYGTSIDISAGFYQQESLLSELGDEYPLKHNWGYKGYSWFTSNNDCRLQKGVKVIDGQKLSENGLRVYLDYSSQLNSTVSKHFIDDAEGEPVLFIHGYKGGHGYGGGEATWERFPKLISELNNNGATYIPFEFQWRTNARFQDAANDLASYIRLIALTTEKKVHIVAHSFGGALIRAVLQRLNADGLNSVEFVASLTTLGTPHSGIADEYKTMHGLSFPEGQDSSSFEFAGQISTHQMGEYDSFVSKYNGVLGVEKNEGGFAALLANSSTIIPSSLPVQVGIGLTTQRFDNDVIDDGDELISYEGQRFHPNLTNGGAIKTLLANDVGFGGDITEKILGFGVQDVKPGDTNIDSSNHGYKHNDASRGGTPEAHVDCESIDSCDHASFNLVKQFLASQSSLNAKLRLFYLKIRVVDSESKEGLNGAIIDVSANGTKLNIVGDPHTLIDGSAEILVPFFDNTEYFVSVSLDGYRAMIFDNEFRSASTVEETDSEFGKVFLQKNEIGYGDLAGLIVDASTGSALSDVVYKVYSNTRLVASGYSNEGYYVIERLLRGTYNVEFSKPGYLDSKYTYSVIPNRTTAGNGSLRKELAEGQMSIVLSWDVNPGDLDSHLIKLDADGNQLYHIAYYDKIDSTTGDNLDIDDTSSYGPETVTIQSVDSSARYVYAVHHYSGSGDIFTTSNAKITVNYGSSQPITFHAPSSGSGRWWNVFEIIDGQILPFNNPAASVNTDSFYLQSGNVEPVGYSYNSLLNEYFDMPQKIEAQ